MYHTTSYEYHFLEDSENTIYYLRYFLRTILSTCVPLFFFANGFLLLNRKFDLKKHVRKTLRLLCLTVIWGAVVLFLLSVLRKSPFSITEFLIALWNWERGWIDYLWYMGTLVCIYVVFPLIKAAYDNQKSSFYYFMAVTFLLTIGNKMFNLCATIAAYWLTGYDGLLTVNWFNMFNPYVGLYGHGFFYFCLGGCAYGFLNTIEKKRKKCNWIAVAAILLSMGLLFGLGVLLSQMRGILWDVVWHGYDTVFTLVNVLAVFVLTTNYQGSFLGKTVLLISRNTLGIYLIHVVFMECLRPCTRGSNLLLSFSGNILYSVGLLFLSLTAAVLIKRIPGLKHLL